MVALNIVYLVVALLLFLSVIASSLSQRIGMPLLVLFLGIGMLAGEEGLLKLQFDYFFLANMIGQAGLAIILLDGGLWTSFSSVKLALKPASILATWGVVATVGLTGLFIAWMLSFLSSEQGLNLKFGLLAASIVGSTDAAAVFSLLRNSGVKLNERVQSTLEVESGANDPMAIFLMTVLIALNLPQHESQTFTSIALLFISQFGLGLILGAVMGKFLSFLIAKIALPEGMYAILILSASLLTFALTNLLNGSGFLAIYITGMMIGNHSARATDPARRVVNSFAWLAQACLFVILGLLVTPSRVLALWPIALGIALFLMFIARPLAVLTGLLPFRYRLKEVAFISWVGLKGAVPVTLAIMPIMMGVANADLLFDLVFGVVLLSLLIQGTSIPYMAKLCQVKIPSDNLPDTDHTLWLTNERNVHIYEFVVKKGAFAITHHPIGIAKQIDEKNIRLFALVRGGEITPINTNTSLRSGDHVWYTVSGALHPDLSKAFCETYISRQESTDFFGDWILSPSVIINEVVLLEGLIPEEECLQTVGEFVQNRIGKQAVVGDKVSVDDRLSLIVREMSSDNTIASVGLKLNKKS